jgi:hypothetical protein
MSIRTSNQIARMCGRALPETRGASNDQAIGTDDPNTLTDEFANERAAHGRSGQNCIASLEVGTLGAPVTITLWLYSPGSKTWTKAGANSTQYSKSFDSKSMDGWNVPENTLLYFQGSDEIENAWVDFKPAAD